MIPIKYNVKSLFERKGTTLMTIGSIAFVVLVYIGVLALAGGLGAAYRKAGDPTTVIVLRDGARSEMESGYSTESMRILASIPGVARDQEGEVLVSGETVHLQIFERRDGTEANVIVRGVDDGAFRIRDGLQVTRGRRFEPGRSEIVVGRQVADRYPALALGNQVELGRNAFTVVGVFADGGSSLESEIWGGIDDLGDSYRRQFYVSSTRLKATSAGDVPALIDRIQADARLQVEAQPETRYYEVQSGTSSAIFLVLGNVLAFLMAFGACFAAANTMFAQVSARQREIGTLRALGFQRRSIMGAFVIEALVLGLLSGALGALLSLPLNGITAGTMNQASFSEITFSLRTTPAVLLAGVLLATGTALVGGIPPAWSASRRRITNLLRET